MSISKRKAKTHTVIAEGGNLEELSTIQEVLKEFATLLNIDIMVSNPHGKVSEPLNNPGVLHLRFWSCPPGNEEHIKIYSAFEIELSGGQKDAMYYSGMGVEIVDEKGTSIAEYVPGTLYVLFDLPHGDNVELLLTKVMESFASFYSNDPETVKRIQEEINARSEKNFYSLCRSLTGYQKEKVQKDLEANDATIRKAQSGLIAYTRQRRDLQQRLKAITELEKTSDTDSFSKQFNELSEISVTGAIRVSGKSIIIPVGQVDIKHQNVVYDIGVFDIIINTDGKDGGVTCVNHTNKGADKSLFHPHIMSSGRCCLGNISETIVDLISQADYVSVTLIMIDFLSSYNIGGAYSKIENWPIKS